MNVEQTTTTSSRYGIAPNGRHAGSPNGMNGGSANGTNGSSANGTNGSSANGQHGVGTNGRYVAAVTALWPEIAPPDRVVVATYIANDVIRHGIEAVLRQLPTVGAVHQCPSPDEVARLEGRYDVMITDVPAAGGLAATSAPGRPRVLILVDDADAEDAALEVPGADGFLLTHELTADRLSRALAQLGRGELVMPPSLARRLLTRRATAIAEPVIGRARLTDRQLAALRLVADGLSNKQIARRLQISEHGAKRLVTSIMVKLDAPNRTTAVLAAMRLGVIPPPSLTCPT